MIALIKIAQRKRNRRNIMKTDLFTKVVLSVIAVLLCMNLVSGLFSSRPATAEQANDTVNRYQISAWASSIGTFGHHSGYYVIDSTTGKVVDKHEDVHIITPPTP
jgi:hypothetical protein